MKKKEIDERKRDLSILIVDDDSMVLRTIAKILDVADEHYFIETSTCVEKTIDLVKKTYWDTILLDLSLPIHEGGTPDPKNGLHALDVLKNELNITTPIIAITGHYEDELSDIVLDKGAYYFLNKPVKAKYLSAIVKNSTRFQMSGFDGLTGLLNRDTFEERLKSEFIRAQRKNQEILSRREKASQPPALSYLSLIYLDGDNFKMINDTYSHLVGDMVLKKISGSFIDESLYKMLNGEGRSINYIIRPYDLAARFGGDEFCIFMPETNHESALIVAKRIRKMIMNFKISDIVGIDNVSQDAKDISLSIGLATYPDPNNVEHFQKLIELADNAMYASKEVKAGNIFGYDASGQLKKLD